MHICMRTLIVTICERNSTTRHTHELAQSLLFARKLMYTNVATILALQVEQAATLCGDIAAAATLEDL